MPLGSEVSVRRIILARVLGEIRFDCFAGGDGFMPEGWAMQKCVASLALLGKNDSASLVFHRDIDADRRHYGISVSQCLYSL